MLKRTFLPWLIVLAAACTEQTSSAPPPSWVVGKYHYSGTGRVAKKFPWQAQSDLILDRDGQYTLSVTVHIDNQKGADTNHNETYGAYYVDGSRLVLQPASGEDDKEQKFDIRGKQLVPHINWTGRLALRGLKIPAPVFVKTD